MKRPFTIHGLALKFSMARTRNSIDNLLHKLGVSKSEWNPETREYKHIRTASTEEVFDVLSKLDFMREREFGTKSILDTIKSMKDCGFKLPWKIKKPKPIRCPHCGKAIRK